MIDEGYCCMNMYNGEGQYLVEAQKENPSEPSFTYLDHCQIRTYNKDSAFFDCIALKMDLIQFTNI
jgi:hypothetical protein